MKAHLLFPRYFRPIGFVLAIPGLVLGVLVLFFKYQIPEFGPDPIRTQSMFGIDNAPNNFTNELMLTLVVVGLMFVAFSKLRTEDELTAHIRLNALYWAILIHYVVLGGIWLFVILTNEHDIYDPFRILHISLITPLVIFVTRFYYLLYKSKDEYYAPSLHFLPYKPFNTIGKALSLIGLFIVIAQIITALGKPNGVLEEPGIWSYFSWVEDIIPFILLIWVYSKERKEDEYINAIRLNAMQTAIYVNYAILLLANFFIYGLDFLSVEVYNLSTIPLIFIIVFQYRLYKLSKQNDEKVDKAINLNIL